MGRDKRNERRGSKGTFVELRLTETPAFKALSPLAQILLVRLSMEWAGERFNNNGRLTFSYSQACDALGVRKPDTIGKAFQALQAKGFVVVHREATLGVDGKGRSFEFELTTKPMAGLNRRPSKLYELWSPGNDFEVRKGITGNPKGSNRKTESHPEKRDAPIPQKGMLSQSPSQKTGWPIPKKGMKDAV